ncbi:MAG: hypothetical protein ACLT8E_06900 [Akkermansia sp.]
MNRARGLFFIFHAPAPCGPVAARVLMFAAWFGLSVWAAGVVFYNVWGGAVLVWLRSRHGLRFCFRRKRPVFWRASWGVLALFGVLPVHSVTNGKEANVLEPPARRGNQRE